MNFPDTLANWQQQVILAINANLQEKINASPKLAEAIAYVLRTSGKCIRASLVYATGELFNCSRQALDQAASAVELIHAYSLVHDDLPAMDNDDLRRGMPTCHKAYDEATAILVGDALQALAFSCLTQINSKSINLKNQIKSLEILTTAVGANGIVGGQSLDIEAEGKNLTLNELKTIHNLKTGKLITASTILGYSAGHHDIENHILETLSEFGHAIGIAFQIKDDLLDVTSSTEKLGKNAYQDIILDKATYPKLLGIDGAQKELDNYYYKALSSLQKLPQQGGNLQALAKFIIEREK